MSGQGHKLQMHLPNGTQLRKQARTPASRTAVSKPATAFTSSGTQNADCSNDGRKELSDAVCQRLDSQSIFKCLGVAVALIFKATPQQNQDEETNS